MFAAESVKPEVEGTARDSLVTDVLYCYVVQAVGRACGAIIKRSSHAITWFRASVESITYPSW